MIKPSELTPRFSALLKEVIAAKFDATEMLVTGVEDEIAKAFATLPFDHLIFTGSTRVGRLVAEAAGRNLTPVTLELGGKSPAIVDRSADLDEAAERIAYGKLLNAGQTCIAPDYALVPEASVQAFAEKVRAQMRRMFGTDPANKDYTSDHLRPALCAAGKPGRRMPRQGRKDPATGEGRRSELEGARANSRRRMSSARRADDGGDAGGDFRPRAAGAGLSRRRRSRSPSSTRATGRWRSTGSARTAPRATRCCRAPSPAASPSTTACSTSRKSTSRWAASARPAPAPITANGAFDTFSKLKPVFYRSKFNRLADLYPPYGGKIARLEKMMRFMS